MDFEIRNEGSLFLLFPRTREAKAWADENIGEHQTWSGGIVVEHRYIEDLTTGILVEGFTVTLDGRELELAA